jgi:hypothetical protein
VDIGALIWRMPVKTSTYRGVIEMDPVTLAVVTSGVALLAHECARGVADAAGHDIWQKIKSLLGFGSEPKLGELVPKVAQRLQQDEDLTNKIRALLESKEMAHSPAGAVVGMLVTEKVGAIAGHITNATFNL